jgi:hypothetical protein
MRLGRLNPQWISPPGRWGIGLMFDCPVCVSRPHHVFIFFRNPCDGWPQEEDDGEMLLHTRDPRTSGLGDLTLVEAIELECWHGVLREGALLQH